MNADTITLDMNLYGAFWSKLQQLKFDIFYYDEHFKYCVSVSRCVKAGIIIITSLATGAWMNWQDISVICIICPIIIWISQVASAVVEQLPFEKRKIELRELSYELESLYIDMEMDWRSIQAMRIENENIREMLQKYTVKQTEICKHYFKDDALPQIEKIRRRADEKTFDYFENLI